MSRLESHQFRVLMVDDHDLVRTLLRGALRELGFSSIDDAKDGKEGLHMIREAYAENRPYSIVFCDWNMPEMTGVELLDHCRRLPESKDLPFVMLTSEADQKHVFKALSLGASDYIVKPFSPSILEKKVRKIVARIQAAHAAAK